MPLVGKNAIVTGGASGIGLATCRRLARDGVGIGVWDIDYAGAQRLSATLLLGCFALLLMVYGANRRAGAITAGT